MNKDSDTPLRERDLPNPEAMLARILRDVDGTTSVEELDSLDGSPTGSRKWLYAVAAVIAVLALGSGGWVVLHPKVRNIEPGTRPSVSVATPLQSATPGSSPGPGAEPDPELPPEATSAPTTRRPTPRRTPTPSVTPSPTPTSTPTPTPSLTATARPPLKGDQLTILWAEREISEADSSAHFARISFRVCAGNSAATVELPVVTGGTSMSLLQDEPWSRGRQTLSSGSCLISMGTVAIPRTAATVTLTSMFTYPAEYASENGPRSDSISIPKP